VARDLKAHAGKCVVIGGQNGYLELLSLEINNTLGNLDRTTFNFSSSANGENWGQIHDLKNLIYGLNAGNVDWLVILNANPIYNAPADLEFAAAFEKAKVTAHLGSHLDETGQNAQWHIPPHTFWNRGPMRGLTMEPLQSCSH